MPVRILVVIASYGNKQDRYLERVVREYFSTPFSVDVIVLSNIEKKVAPGVKVYVGQPNKNPWSLPFGHKRVFAEHLTEYDLFIYSEDDILITERNIRAFLTATTVLPENEIAGFFRYEEAGQGRRFYPEVHSHWHWDPTSVRIRGNEVFAFFSCEHSACYALTRDQLQRAIASGNFLVEPHEERYDLLCTAATDPYTQCGFRKMICISSWSDFLVHHLPNKYVDRLGAREEVVDAQLRELLKLAQVDNSATSLLRTSTRLHRASYSKEYYEPVQDEMIREIPFGARTILSVGSGSGETEKYLAEKGFRVTSLPLDPVVASAMNCERINLVVGDLTDVIGTLDGHTFDCILLPNILHLMEDPDLTLNRLSELMTSSSVIIARIPNLCHLRVARRMLEGAEGFRSVGSFEKTGVQYTSRRVIRKWFSRAGLEVRRMEPLFDKKDERHNRKSLGLMRPLLVSEFIAVCSKSQSKA